MLTVAVKLIIISMPGRPLVICFVQYVNNSIVVTANLKNFGMQTNKRRGDSWAGRPQWSVTTALCPVCRMCSVLRLIAKFCEDKQGSGSTIVALRGPSKVLNLISVEIGLFLYAGEWIMKWKAFNLLWIGRIGIWFTNQYTYFTRKPESR